MYGKWKLYYEHLLVRLGRFNFQKLNIGCYKIPNASFNGKIIHALFAYLM